MNKKLILLLGGLFFLCMVGGLGFSVMRRSSGPAARKKAEPEHLTAMELDEFIVNLADTDSQHYLKAGVVLEMRGETPKGGEGAGPSPDTPQIRDAIITAISRKRFDELLTYRGKQALKNSIRLEVNRSLGKEKVAKVYFTSFAMQ